MIITHGNNKGGISTSILIKLLFQDPTIPIKLKCTICGDEYECSNFFKHATESHANKSATFVMKLTEVVVNLQVVQEIIAYRLQYAFDEIINELSEAGVPTVSVPRWDIARFGTNLFIVGFVAEQVDLNWIETIHPDTYIRMSQLPGFDSYLTRQRFRPTPPRKSSWLENYLIWRNVVSGIASIWRFLLRCLRWTRRI